MEKGFTSLFNNRNTGCIVYEGSAIGFDFLKNAQKGKLDRQAMARVADNNAINGESQALEQGL